MDNNDKRKEYLEKLDILQTLIKNVDPDNKIYQGTLKQLGDTKEKLTSESSEPVETKPLRVAKNK